MSTTALSIITAALRKLGVEAAGEIVSADNSQFMFGELNRMVDSWCARNLMLYSRGFQQFTLIVSHQPHTIGTVIIGAEVAPALVTPQWTLGAGWAYATPPDSLEKTAGAGTATPAGVTPIVIGVTYKVVITVAALSVSTATWTLGGVAGTPLTAAGTFTYYITAVTTAPLVITPVAAGLLMTIYGISIKPLSNNPDFACAVGRPVKIIHASLVLTAATPNVDIPLELLDDDGWADVRVKALASTLPTKLYYSPDFPNGSIYLWPIPITVNDLRLETRNMISRFADLTTDYDFPFGYEDALVCSLAEAAMVSYPRPEMEDLVRRQAQAARALIASVNAKSPNISTTIGASGGRGSSWHFLTGGYRP